MNIPFNPFIWNWTNGISSYLADRNAIRGKYMQTMTWTDEIPFNILSEGILSFIEAGIYLWLFFFVSPFIFLAFCAFQLCKDELPREISIHFSLFFIYHKESSKAMEKMCGKEKKRENKQRFEMMLVGKSNNGKWQFLWW